MFNIVVVGDPKKPQELLLTLNTIAADRNGRRVVSLLNVSIAAIDAEMEAYQPIFADKELATQRISDTPGFMAKYEAFKQLREFLTTNPVTMVEPDEGEGLPSLVNAAIEAEDYPYALIIEGGTMFPHPWYMRFYQTLYTANIYKNGPVAVTGRLVNLSNSRVVCAGVRSVTASFPEYMGFGDHDTVVRYNTRLRVLHLPKEFMIVTRDAWKHVGGFDPKYKAAFWDFDFSAKIAADNKLMFYEPDLRLSTYDSIINRMHKSSLPADYMRMYEQDYARYIKLHGGSSDG